MRNKRGGIGSGIAMFFAIILIAIMLGAFIFLSSIWKAYTEKVAGVEVASDFIDDTMFSYMEFGNESIEEVRFLVASGKDVGDAIEEVGYE